MVRKSARFIDIFHCNNDEAKSMTGIEDEKQAVKELLSLGITLPVISMGERGLICGYKNSLYIFPPFRINLADATGAGDAFCAGVMRKIIDFKGRSLKKIFLLDENELMDAMLYGAAVGAVCVTAAGTTTNVCEQKVNELIKDQGHMILESVIKR